MKQSFLMLLCFVLVIENSFGTILKNPLDIVRRNSNSNINTNINVNHNRKIDKSNDEKANIIEWEKDESNETIRDEKIGIIDDNLSIDSEKLLIEAAAAAADASKEVAEILITELTETIADAVGEAVARILLNKKDSLTKATARALILRRNQNINKNNNINIHKNHRRKPVEPVEPFELIDKFKDDNNSFDNKLRLKKKKIPKWTVENKIYQDDKLKNFIESKDDCGNPLKRRSNSRRCLKKLLQKIFFE